MDFHAAGGFLAVVLCWALLVVYLVTLLEWMPAPFIFRQANTGHVTSTTASLPATRAQPTGTNPSFFWGLQCDSTKTLLKAPGRQGRTKQIQQTSWQSYGETHM
jgi:hypothetical protein